MSGGGSSVARDGDWWLLGRHRVGCGSLADAAAAMLSAGENMVVLLAADPAAADAVIRGWRARTGGTARHAASGRDFAEPSTATEEESNPG